MTPATRPVGAFVWAGVIASTCLLLIVFEAILWLVVPFLLALVLYYALRPLVRRLVFAGVEPDLAAVLVTGGFLLLLAGAGLLLAPRMAEQALSWQGSLARYLEGGAWFLRQAIGGLEARFDLLARAHVGEGIDRAIDEFTNDFARRHAASFVVTLGTWVPALLLAPFFTFFFLRDGRRFQSLLTRAVPNAFFERTLYVLDEVDRTAHAYFQGLLRLTLLDALTLAAGLWFLGISGPLALGAVTAVLAWIPYVGSILGCLIVVLVAATDFPNQPSMAYGAIVLFLLVRLLDDFVFMPMTIGRSLHIHPLVSVLMIFIGGAIAGVAGLMLVLPLLGVVLVVGDTIGRVVTDPRLRARHRHARALAVRQASADLS